MRPYTYRVIRYIHDPAIGEALNVGVLLYDSASRYLGLRIDPLYERLSTTFVDFDGENYRRYVERLEASISRWKERLEDTLDLIESPADIAALTRLIWPDTGTSFQPGPVFAGVTVDIEAELETIFDRMVTSQCNRDKKTRLSDRDVWTVYQRSIPVEIRRMLREKTFETPEVEVTFEHTLKNGFWNVLEPVSLDYANAQSIQRKALDLLGIGVALEKHPELGNFYVLLGPPQNEAYRTRYNRAKDLIHKMPINKRIVEEDAAADFGNHLAEVMLHTEETANEEK